MPSKFDGAHELLRDWANHGNRLRVGLFAIGLEAYWSQFAGLRQQLTGHAERVARLLERSGVEVVNLGMIDSPEKAMAAGHAFRRADVDLLFLHVATYSLSSTVLPGYGNAGHRPGGVRRDPGVARCRPRRSRDGTQSPGCHGPLLRRHAGRVLGSRSEEHTSELQSLRHLVCRLLLAQKN